MYNLKRYNINFLKYDLINKFNYSKTNDIPKLVKIVLTFSSKSFELKKLASTLLALKLITNKNGTLTVSKKPNILLKIRKGNPVGCKIVLTKELMYKFLEKLIVNILPKMKNVINIKSNRNINCLNINLSNPLIFKELEKNYFLFNSLKNLQITIIFNSKSPTELLFLLNSFKLLVKSF